MAQKITIHAVNIHKGGGINLLRQLMSVLQFEQQVVLNIDSRATYINHGHIKVIRIKPYIINRLLSEITLRNRETDANDILLCMGNLPPLFRNKAKTILFLQNRYLVDTSYDHHLSFRHRLKLFVERCWLSIYLKNVDDVIVQTSSMKTALRKRKSSKNKIHILPFIGNEIELNQRIKFTSDAISPNTYIYPASGEPHKNHITLIQAWKILADEGFTPSLILTLHADFYEKLETKLGFSLSELPHIKNIGLVSYQEMQNYYAASTVLIYPSLMESFGMPLIEAMQLGLPIITGELDYIRDLVDPVETFDPHSPLSIVRAIKRFCNYDEKRIAILDAENFWRAIANL